MNDGDPSHASIDFGTENNFQHAIIRFGNIAGRDIIINHDPHDVTLLRGLNPYLGLKNFTYADHRKYAGRAPQIAAAVAYLTTPGDERSFLLVTGTSGSGKSSFVQAGVLPQLVTHYRNQGIDVTWDVFRPSSSPMASLTASLRRLGARIPLGDVISMARWGTVLTETLPEQTIPCLVIDQFEEVFSLHVPSEERSALFNLITTLPSFRTFPIHIIATLRSDFLPELFETALVSWIGQGINLQVMDEHMLRQAIERPVTYLMDEVAQRLPELAQRLGPKQWDQGVLTRLAQDAAQDASYLPLLQVTLQHIWQKGLLTLNAYTDLTTAIQERAELVWQVKDYDGGQQTPRSDVEQQAMMALFLDLVDVSLDNDTRRDVRRSVSVADLTTNHAERADLIEDLVRARLLSRTRSDDGTSRHDQVDIIHESLLRNWPRLTEEIQHERTALQQRARFRDDLAQWQSSGHILEGVRLAAALELVQRGDAVTHSAAAQTLLEQSLTARDADQATREAEREARLHQAEAAADANRQRAETQMRLTQRTRRFLAVTLVLFVLSLGTTWFAVNRQRIAQQNAQRLQQQLRISESQRLATEARSQGEHQPEKGLLLAYESLAYHDNSVSNTTMRGLLERNPWTVTPLVGHTGKLSTAVFNPDGALILTASEDAMARLWQRDGTQTGALSGHTKRIHSAMFSPDGSLILTASDDTTARLWRNDGNPVRMLNGHTDAVTSAVFSPDGALILTASEDKTARLWRTDGTLLQTLTGHTNAVTSAVFSPDGTQILTASEDKTARLWRSDGTLIHVLKAHTSVITSAIFSPDGTQILTTARDTSAYLWRNDGTLLSTITDPVEIDFPESAFGHTLGVFSPDGTQILTASWDRIPRLWNRDGSLITSLPGHTGWILSAVFSPDGSRILTASADDTARLWNRDGTLIALLAGHMENVSSAMFSPDGSQIVTASDDTTARLWQHDDAYSTVVGSAGAAITSAVFSPDESLILTTDGLRRTADLWHRNGAHIAELPDVLIAAFSPNSSQILTTGKSSMAHLWSNDGTSLAMFKGHTDIVINAHFSPDGSQILTVSSDNTARLWHNDGTLIAILAGHTAPIFSEAFSPDGTQIVTTSEDQTARLWRSDGTLLRVLTGHTDRVINAHFSPDGAQLITISWDHTVRVWGRDGTILAILSGHDDVIPNATFSPDGSRILTASWDGTARVWERDGDVIAVLRGPEDELVDALFSPDGQQILTIGKENPPWLWGSDGHRIAVLTGHESRVLAAAFSPDSTQIATTSVDDTTRLWNSDGSLAAVLSGHTDDVISVLFSSNGTHILTGSWDGTARIDLSQSKDLLKVAACRVGRELTAEERVQFSVPNPTFVFAERACPPMVSRQK